MQGYKKINKHYNWNKNFSNLFKYSLQISARMDPHLKLPSTINL
jgi:hypothetical protein